jgi:hypothetical protein
MYLTDQVIPFDRLRQAKLPSKENALLSRCAVPNPSPIDSDEGLVAAAEQPWETGSERARARPPVQPKIGHFPIPNLVPCPQFKVPFDLMDGIPKLGAP